MKKKSLLITLVALTLLSSMLLSSILGVTKAEYFKTLSKKLDFQSSPDLALQYYLYDAARTDGSAFKESNGVYKTSKSFSQKVVVGIKKQYDMDEYGNTGWKVDLTKNQLDENKYPDAYITPDTDALNLKNFDYCGEGIIYQIKLPVDEAGYYVLNFQVDFELAIPNNKYANEVSDFFTQTYDRAIGCEILNHNDGFTFGDSSKYLDLYTRSGNDSVYGTSAKADKENVKYFEADSLYQWKTLSPSRAENVSLAFKVEEGDVEKGYVIWMWDFAGLFGGRTWRLNFTGVSVEKTMELDGSTDYRDGNIDPYFMFPQTSFVNNQHVLSTVDLSNRDIYDYPVDTSVRGVRARGKTSYSKGRGTFATSATANSLTFQAESIFYGFGNNESSWGGKGLEYKEKGYLNELDGEPAWSNPVVASIPLKNIKFDTDYKVTFDLSIARQGTYDVGTNNDGEGDASFLHPAYFNGIDYDNKALPLVEYADPTQDLVLRKGTKLFSSYLFSGVGDRRTETTHKENMQQIKYADKSYQGKPLTKYDEINSLATLNRSIVQSVNNTYCNENTNSDASTSTQSRNWFNAVCHTEYNGQNKINWLTFYNTTFTFNIDGSDDNNKEKLKLDDYGYIKDLNWVWAMDSLISGCYYRIKLENVRIEKVVKYTSSLNDNGVKIAGSQIDLTNHAVAYNADSLGFRGEDENNIFYSLRGISGTGQQYQARGFVLDDETTVPDKVFTSEGNIYAPIIDATKFIVRPNDTSKPRDANEEHPPTADAYKIALSGFAVCQGGVEKYVFSVDGGQTWQDMTFNGSDAQVDQLTSAEKGVNQYISGTTRYTKEKFTTIGENINDFTHIGFTANDAANGSFNDFTLVADLTEYKNEANLDVIIAAVPTENINYRCEILRIINFNQIKNYVNFPYDFVSDITVNNKDEGPSLLNAFRLDESHLPDNQKPHYHNGLANPEAIGFTMTKIYSLRDKRAQSTTAYARMGTSSYDYEDIKTAFSDFPIYNELSITGWAIVEGGVQNYYWSADHGKTWTKCSGTAVKYTNSTNNDLISPSYAYHFYSELGKEDSTIGKEKHRFEDSIDGAFNANDVEAKKNVLGTMLTADLSNYVGEVVDVIFAAKPNESDVYVPVGRIDNVGVYGANGTFYSRVHKVFIDGRTNDDLSNVSNTTVTPDLKDLSNEDLNLKYKWGLGYSSEMCYVIYEPQNVNPINARYISKQVQTIKSGGRVTIDGYVMCKGGVERYKYSLDGGVTWTVINDEGTKITKTSMINYCKPCDNSFTSDVDDGLKGDFCCTTSDTTYTGKKLYDHALEFNIPALKDGTERDLLVVAEGKYNKNIPVLHMKIRVQGGTKYGYHNIAGASDTSFGTVQGGYFTGEQSLKFTPTQGSRVINRITIPVTEEGDYQLTFNHRIQGAQNSENAKIEISFVHDEGEYTYFCDRTRQFTSIGTNKNANSDHIYTIPDASKNEDYRAITASVSVTEADVKRGYIVLDINYNNLTLETEYTATINLSEDALVKKTSGFLFDMPLMTAPTGYANAVFMNTATTAGDYDLSVNPMINPPIKKGGVKFTAAKATKYANTYISVPKTYFNVGEPITVNYNSSGLSSKGYIYITKDYICKNGKFGNLYLKQAEVSANTEGFVEFKADTYNLTYSKSTYQTDNVNVSEAKVNELKNLPVGEYKIWFIDGTTSFHVYDQYGSGDAIPLATETISIKVVDPADPDISMTHWANIPYGTYAVKPTSLSLGRVVYEQGEDIPYRINGNWEGNWVTIVKYDDFKGYLVDNLTHSPFNTYQNKNGTYSRYAEWGSYAQHPNDLSGGVLKTVDNGVMLEPGQYKIIYLFGQCLDHAWQGIHFPEKPTGVKQKIITIIDITILPKDSMQNISVSYTKNDGSIGAITVNSSKIEDTVTTTETVVDMRNETGFNIFTGANATLLSNSLRVSSRPTLKELTFAVPNDVDINATNNVAVQTTITNFASSKKFNILCPTYSFRKKSS